VAWATVPEEAAANDDGTAGLVGRDDELDRVAQLIAGDRPVAVVGEAGIGKTVLVQAAALRTDRLLRGGGGFATLTWMPYLPLSRALDRPVSGEPAHVAGAVERFVGPDLLVIDDLQWSDRQTLDALALLAGRVGLAVTIREGDPGSAAAVALMTSIGAELIHLGGLDRAACVAIALRQRADLSERAVADILRHSGGNPLLIEEFAGRGEGSPTLSRAIARQLDDLRPDARSALELIALAESGVPSVALGPVSKELVRLRLVVDVDGQLEVRHALIAKAVADAVSDEARRTLHSRLAELAAEPAVRARHLLAAGQRAAAHEVARSALEATTDPRTQAVLLAIAAEGGGPDESALRVRAAMQLKAIGDSAGAIALLEEPLVGDDELLTLGAAVLGGALDHEGRGDEAMAVLEGARDLGTSRDSEGAIELAVVHSSALVNQGRLQDALATVEAAAMRAGPAAAGYRLAGHMAAIRLYAGRSEQLGALEDAVAAALAAGDGGVAAGRALDLYYMMLARHGAAEARRFALDAARRLDNLGFQTRADELRAESAQATIFAGELRATVHEVDVMLEAPLGLLSRQRLMYNRGLALGLLGHVEDAERTLEDCSRIATNDFDGQGATLWCWAEASLWSGQPGRALEQARAALTYRAFNDSEYVLPALALAWAEVELGGRPTTASMEVPFRLLAGAAPELRGLHARARGDHAAAAAAFEEAASSWAGFLVLRELVCRWGAGEALRLAGRRAEAVASLGAVLHGATTIGFEPLAARARRSLRLAGERPAPIAPASRARGLLTPRELEILALVERGLTNTEIARRMSLGRPTVARLLSNAMLKLGAGSRAQAIVLAAEAI